MLSAGNMALRATPMRALAASIVRWALAMSGRRSSRLEGRPAGISGRAARGFQRIARGCRSSRPAGPAAPPAHARKWRAGAAGRSLRRARSTAPSWRATGRIRRCRPARSGGLVTRTLSSRRRTVWFTVASSASSAAQPEIGLRDVGLQRQQHRAVGRLAAPASPRAAATLLETRPNRSTS
jgi:hypothetical protein